MSKRSFLYLIARAFVAVASPLVPRWRRRQWRETWHGELWHGSGRPGSKVVRRSTGAVPHALWLRAMDWSRDGLLRDLRYGARSLRKQPGFTAVALVILTLGIGATTTIFSLVNGLLVRPLGGVEAPAELVGIWRLNQGRPDNWSYPNFRGIGEATDAFDGAVAYSRATLTLRGDDAFEPVAVQLVSRDYFDVLGVDMHRGEGLDPTSGTPDVVLGYGAWQRRFGGREIIGDSIEVNGVSLHVAGIAAPAFSGLERAERPEAWVAVDLEVNLGLRPSSSLSEVGNSWLKVVARLAPGTSLAAAQASTDLAMERLREDGLNRDLRAVVAPATGLAPDETAEAGLILGMLMAVVGLLLLIACANVANLMLARGRVRAREYGVRLAIGASRGRLVRQLLVEGLLLSLTAAVAAMLMAQWSAALIVGLFETVYDARFSVVVSPDARILAFSIAIAAVSVMVFGLVPAYRAARHDAALLIATGGSSGARRAWLAGTLVVGQVALSVVVLVISVLFVRSLQVLNAVDSGMDTDRLLVVTLQSLAPAGTEDGTDGTWRTALEEQVRRMPDVEEVAWFDRVPLGGGISRQSAAPGSDVDPEQVSFNAVGPGFFRAAGVELLKGRDFMAADDTSAPRVAVVNEALAQRFWPGDEPLGRYILVRAQPYEVIGVVATSKYRSLTERPTPFLYTAFAQQRIGQPSLMIRATGEPADIAPRIAPILESLEGTIIARGLVTMDQVITASFGQQAMFARVVGLFGVIALLLAVAGAYGVTSYVVNQRTAEIGIRIAIGASSGAVVRSVVLSTVSLATIGVALGVLLAAAAAPTLASLTPGIAPSDPPTFVVAASVMLLSVAFAGLVPARRASRVDPLIALRNE